MNSKKLVGTLAAIGVAAIAPASAVASAPDEMHLEQISMGVKAPEPLDTGGATGLFPLENIQITSVKAPEPSENVPADDQMKYYLENARPSKVEISGLNDIEAIDFNTLGTQVGSEGVKAPKPSDTRACTNGEHINEITLAAPKPADTSVCNGEHINEVTSA